MTENNPWKVVIVTSEPFDEQNRHAYPAGKIAFWQQGSPHIELLKDQHGKDIITGDKLWLLAAQIRPYLEDGHLDGRLLDSEGLPAFHWKVLGN